MANPNAKPPKRKKSHGRKVKGGNKKHTNYDYAAARETLALPANATSQEIAHHATLGDRLNDNAVPAIKSPLKSEYKAMLMDERAKNEGLAAKAEKAVKAVAKKEHKILSLKDENKMLALALRDEREKSRLTILKLLDDAEIVISDANSMKSDAEQKMSVAELTVFNEQERMKLSVQKEGEYNYFQVASRKLLSFDIVFDYILSNLIILFVRSQTKTQT
jgi:hypothetical protein